jgi:hypothetical protein
VLAKDGGEESQPPRGDEPLSEIDELRDPIIHVEIGIIRILKMVSKIWSETVI